MSSHATEAISSENASRFTLQISEQPEPTDPVPPRGAVRRIAQSGALEEGLDHLRAQRWGQAISSLRSALCNEPGRLAAVRALATAYLHAGDCDAAQALLESFTQDYPMHAESWLLAAQLQWKLNYRTQAIEMLYAGVKRLPLAQSLHRQLAVFLAADGQVASAVRHIGQTQPDARLENLEAYLAAAAGECHRVGKLVQATTRPASTSDSDWLDQIAADPALLTAILGSIRLDSPLSAHLRAMLLELEWRLARLLETQPQHADRHLLLAKLQARLGATASASRSVQEALRINPKLVDAHRLQAQLHAMSGQIDEAVKILRQLVKNGLAWPDIHYEIAALESQLGRAAEARPHLQSALRINPGFEQARTLLKRCAA